MMNDKQPIERLGFPAKKAYKKGDVIKVLLQTEQSDNYSLSVLDPLKDGKSSIELIDYMGNDLSIVNDARVSYNKHSSELTEKDEKLIKYLIEHKHESPLRGVVFKFRVVAPLFCCRQWWKHVVSSNHTESQLSWNEQSFRYVEVEDEFYVPANLRKQSQHNKQQGIDLLREDDNITGKSYIELSCMDSLDYYKDLISLGVCREQARIVLPSAIYTKWIWTGSLQTVLHFIDLRKGEGAQEEIKQYAIAIEKLIAPIVPITMKYWSA